MDVEQMDCEIVCQANNSPMKPLNDCSLKISKKSNSTAPKKSAEERKLEKVEKERRRSELLEAKEKKKEQQAKDKEERQQKIEQKKLEKEKLQAQRLAAKREREEAKVRKENERKQQELEKQAAKQKLEDEKRQRELEKRQKELDKAAQKSKREEEKRQHELEKQRLEEEKKAKEERKKQEFAKYFVKVQKNKSDEEDHKLKFDGYAPGFAVKKGMYLAPLVRRSPLTESESENFDSLLENQNLPLDSLYLRMLKSGQQSVSTSSATATEDSTSSDIVVMGNNGENARSKIRPKFLQFHDNNRPPYFGTWRKSCLNLKNGRRPFARAYNEFNYDEDSDEEWEAEPDDAEECKSDEEDDEKDSNADSDEDNAWLVDHGYLSSDEEQNSSMDAPEHQDLDAETRRERMKIKAEAWKSEKLCKKWEKLKPIVIGPVYDNENSLPGPYVDLLQSFKAIAVDSTFPIVFVVPEQPAPCSPKISMKKEKAKKRASINSIDTYCRPTTPAKKVSQATDVITTVDLQENCG